MPKSNTFVSCGVVVEGKKFGSVRDYVAAYGEDRVCRLLSRAVSGACATHISRLLKTVPKDQIPPDLGGWMPGGKKKDPMAKLIRQIESLPPEEKTAFYQAVGKMAGAVPAPAAQPEPAKDSPARKPRIASRLSSPLPGDEP